MVETAKRNLSVKDVLRVVDTDTGAVSFQDITKEDLTAKGKLRPVGARHYASQAQLVQNLTQLFNSPLGQIIQPDLSRKELTKLIEEIMGLSRYKLFKDNIAIVEQKETQSLINESTNACKQNSKCL